MINNLRDIKSDPLSGKRTLAVRIGDHRSRTVYALFVLVPFVLAAALAFARPYTLLTLLALRAPGRAAYRARWCDRTSAHHGPWPDQPTADRIRGFRLHHRPSRSTAPEPGPRADPTFQRGVIARNTGVLRGRCGRCSAVWMSHHVLASIHSARYLRLISRLASSP